MRLAGKLSPLILAVIALGAVLAYINLPQSEQGNQQQAQATPVRVATVTRQSFPVTIEALGTATANESVSITAQVTDTVHSIHFDDGDTVAAGALLVQLNNDEEKARIDELKANIAEAQRQRDRIQNLRQSSAASEQLLDEQQARVEALTAQLDVARAQLQDLQIAAPFAGLLGIREISKGSLVRPADIITTLDDISVIKVDFSVAERHLASLSAGQRISATSAAYPQASFEGKVSTIGSRVDPVTRSVMVRALIDNADSRLRPGMLLTIVVEKRVLDTLVIPEKALVPVQDKQFVFVLEGDTVTQQAVTIGIRKPGQVQVTEGLDEGSQIVTEGTLRVRDGSRVSVLNAGEDA
ncbi:efflux RND transporter periplasmic adaptor subunit [Alteromonas halophila]|uniref:MexH family multidrug efflux RND transporter periplasmic adaptor subunit n=1 Tax=Alteromonas halophila TaxID=516698 RepID=A0A918MX45_9ALTE|nr:efflux RND transporter periplasmic adaptor subunit [Alteromonas halophila]GGW80402.1 MexH family multidrug efflux RND transporter periplasmic adaptor subunit [Alteromonas halophila]